MTTDYNMIKPISSAKLDPNIVVEIDGVLHREVPEAVPYRWSKLFDFIQSDTFQRMHDLGFVVRHARVPIIVEGRRFFQIERVRHVTLATEWTRRQLVDALLLVCRMNKFLMECGCGMIANDPHLGNVTFRYTEPVYLDAGSFSHVDGVKISAIDHFNWGLADFGIEVTSWDEGIKVLSELQASDASTDIWDNYNPAEIPSSITEIGPHSHEEQLIADWVRRCVASDVFDAGGNDGRLARLLAAGGTEVVVVDTAPQMVARSYLSAKALKIPITSAVVDLRAPGEWRQRLRCEAVLASSITHHLFRSGMDFNAQAELWRSVGSKCLLVEFIDRTDPHLKPWNLPEEYSKKSFLQSLQEWRLLEEACPESPARFWYLFEKV